MPPGRLPVEDFGKCPNESRPLDKPRACSRDNVTHLARKCPVNARRHGWHYKLPCLGLCRKWMYLHKATTLFLLSSTWCWHWLTAGQRPLYTDTSSSVNCASLFISTDGHLFFSGWIENRRTDVASLLLVGVKAVDLSIPDVGRKQWLLSVSQPWKKIVLFETSSLDHSSL